MAQIDSADHTMYIEAYGRRIRVRDERGRWVEWLDKIQRRELRDLAADILSKERSE